MYETRKKYIMQQLEEKEPLSVKDIRDALNVSAMTVQRDLTKLESEGLITKGFGEITRVKGIYLDQLMAVQEQDYPDSQREIARAARSLVEDGDTLFFGNGNIVVELTKQIKDKKVMSVTPSMRAGLSLYKGAGQVYLTGGLLSNDAKSLYGEYAERILRDFYVDKAFITCATVNNHGEICEYSEEEVRLKKILFSHAKKTILLLENDKFGLNKLFKAGDMSNISMVVTNKKLAEPLANVLRENGVKLMYTKKAAKG